MKKLIYLLAIVFLLPVLSGCEDFLDTKNYTSKDGGSFPKSPEDVAQLLTGVYAQFNQMGVMDDYSFVAELVCDDRFGGGGEDDKSAQAVSHLMYYNSDQFASYWSNRYTGIARANVTLDAIELMDDYDAKAQQSGEAKFLRALWYFELVQLLGDVPLMSEVPQSAEEAKVPPPQATQEEIFKQIATDLWEAYDGMPVVSYRAYPSGTVTKWAAAGLLARVWLFYTGFYNKTELPMAEGVVTKNQVIAALEECMDKSKSGHDLVADFRQLWSYSNTATMKDYPYVQDMASKGLEWLEGSFNPEVVFATKFTNMGQWDPGGLVAYSNQIPTMTGVRGQGNNYPNFFPMTEGWGIGQVNPQLWAQWQSDEPNDIRRVASIYNLQDEAVDASQFSLGGDNHMEETGLWAKKMMAVGAYAPTGILLSSFLTHPDYLNTWETRNDYQLDHGQDVIRIRFADILLMHSELTGTATGINQVRKRAGLGEVPYSLANLQKERHYELAFEGLRWGDIRRWGIAEQALTKMYGEIIYNKAKQTLMKEQSQGGAAQRYRDTKGFFNKPLRELDLSEGAYTQNPGWDQNPNANYTMWRE